MADPRLIPIGRIVGVFGVKGWVKVSSDTNPPANILSYAPWYVCRNGQWHSYAVAEAQAHGKGFIARLEGCSDRDRAMEFNGCDIAVDRAQLPVLSADEHYWIDLTGLAVVNQQGIRLGNVSHLFATGANDVLVVQDTQGKDILIPYVPDYYILNVDTKAGTITVDWEAEA